MTTKQTILLHGGDYNPDQWPMEVWQDDMRLMRLAGVNSATVGVFSWSQLEPCEGVYDFDGMDKVIDLLHENGVGVILATPSAAQPAWMSQKYPEVLRVGANRVRNLHGDRVNYCLTSPLYREKCREMAERLAGRYGNHPALRLWHVNNEYGGECHCPLCQKAFQEWLQKKYTTLDRLNDAWGNAFWSHRYDNWSQIESPAPHGEHRLHHLTVDWNRFITHQTIEFFRNEAQVLRTISPRIPCTTNFYWLFSNFDFRKFVPELDVVSCDSYPMYHDRPNNSEEALFVSFAHDLYRSAKRAPFLLMECCPGTTAVELMKLKRPGVIKQQALQAVAHGSDSVLYFQWRMSRGGAEQFHAGVVSHNGGEQTRVFGEVAEIGRTLAELAPVAGSSTQSEVAIIYDPENNWSIGHAVGIDPNRKDYVGECLRHYKTFWECGVSVDIIHADADFSGYKLLIAPMLYMLRPGTAEKIEGFVRGGGVFVSTYWSGVVDENGFCFEGGFPGPLKTVLGIRSEEIDVLYEEENNSVHCEKIGPAEAQGSYEARVFCEYVTPKTAKVLGIYEKEFYAGKAALTCNEFGRGKAYYIAFRSDKPFLYDFYLGICTEIGINSALGAQVQLPDGVTAQVRTDGTRRFIFVMNFNKSPQVLRIVPNAVNMIDFFTREPVAGDVFLGSYDVRVFEQMYS